VRRRPNVIGKKEKKITRFQGVCARQGKEKARWEKDEDKTGKGTKTVSADVSNDGDQGYDQKYRIRKFFPKQRHGPGKRGGGGRGKGLTS